MRGRAHTPNAVLCCAPGYLGNESLPPVVASMTVQLCSAADLGPALGTMLTRLFPHIFRVRTRHMACRCVHTRACAVAVHSTSNMPEVLSHVQLWAGEQEWHTDFLKGWSQNVPLKSGLHLHSAFGAAMQLAPCRVATSFMHDTCLRPSSSRLCLLFLMPPPVIPPQAQAPLRRSQLLAQELAMVQREAQRRSGPEEPGFAEEAAARRSELVRRLRRRLDRLQAQLEASTVEVRAVMMPLEHSMCLDRWACAACRCSKQY